MHFITGITIYPAIIRFCVPVINAFGGAGIFRNLLPIGYASRPHLRTRLTLSGLTFLRKPWVFGGRVSRPSSRYSFRHNHFCFVQPTLPVDLRPSAERSPTTPSDKSEKVRSFGIKLIPVYFRRKITRPVSCYALFKGWLLLSQPPGCLSNFTSFTT
jgi:hypothetical protein